MSKKPKTTPSQHRSSQSENRLPAGVIGEMDLTAINLLHVRHKRRRPAHLEVRSHLLGSMAMKSSPVHLRILKRASICAADEEVAK